MFVAKFSRSDFLYRRCHDGITDQPLGLVTSIEFRPKWITGRWKLVVKGTDWGRDTEQEYAEHELDMLMVSEDTVTITELASILHRAQQVVDVARQVIGQTPGFEDAAEITLNKRFRLVTKVIMANDLNYATNMKLLLTEHFLLSIAPISAVQK